MGYGIGGFLALSVQNSFGTQTNTWDYVPIISESLTTAIEQIISEGLYGRFDEPDSREGLMTIAGDVVFEPHPLMLGHFLKGVTGQASSTLVNTTGGNGYSWEFLPKQTDFDDLCALPPYTLQVHRNVGSAWQFTDAIVHTLALDISGSVIVKATANIMARVSSLMPFTVASYHTGDPWTWDQASISAAGAAIGDMESMTVTIDNPVEGVVLLNGDKFHARYKRTGYRTVRVSGNQDFSLQTEYNKFRQSSRQSIAVNIDDTSVNTWHALNIEIPKMVYMSYDGGISGPGRISASYEGKGEYDVSSSYQIRFTLTNTKAFY